MVKPASGQPQASPQDLDSLLARREALLRELRQIENRIAGRLSVGEQRELAAKPLHGLMTYHGDVVEPTGEKWEAEQ